MAMNAEALQQVANLIGAAVAHAVQKRGTHYALRHQSTFNSLFTMGRKTYLLGFLSLQLNSPHWELYKMLNELLGARLLYLG